MGYLKRDIEEKILEASSQFACITLYGSRQVGKSTLIQRLFPEMTFVTLDDDETRDFALMDPKGFLKYYPSPLIIDEIQKAPELLDYIKIEIDENKFEWLKNGEPLKLLYILSGSNQFELQEAVSESLAGRTAVFRLSSLSYNEISSRGSHHAFEPDIATLMERGKELKDHRSRKKIFEDIFAGGMPEYVLEKPDRTMFFKSYISTYIEKDVKKVIQASKETVFRNFMKYVALRTACAVDYAEISRSVGIDVRTVKDWLSILETSGIIVLIHPYLPNLSDRIIKASKLYFMDTGLCAYLSGFPSAEILEASAFAGPFYETYAVSEILKSWQNAYRREDDIHYYRDRDQYEVDLLIDTFDSLYPIEIKKGVGSISHKKSFSCLEKYGKEIKTGLVIDSSDRLFPINRSVYVCPLDLIGL